MLHRQHPVFFVPPRVPVVRGGAPVGAGKEIGCTRLPCERDGHTLLDSVKRALYTMLVDMNCPWAASTGGPWRLQRSHGGRSHGAVGVGMEEARCLPGPRGQPERRCIGEKRHAAPIGEWPWRTELFTATEETWN